MIMGSKNWSGGEVVNAGDFNAFLANQVVMVFADATARDAGFGGSGEPTLAEGMVCYLSDTNEVQVYGGSAWATIADADVMVVDSANGRVGIGTASPLKILHVEESDSGVTPSVSHHIIFESADDMGVLIGSGTDKNGYLRFGDSDSQSVGGFNYDHDDDSLKIRTNGTDHIKIDSAGAVMVGTTTNVDNANIYIRDTTSYGRLRISGEGSGYTQADVLLKTSDNQRGAGIYMFNSHNDKNWFMGNPNPTPDTWQVSRYSSSIFREATANTSTSYQRFVVDSGGSCYNKTGTYGTISDLRLKTDVETARSYLADLNDIRVITYRIDKYEDINEDTGELEFFPLDEPSDKMLGFAAQEIEEVFPAMIGTGGSGVKAVKQSVLVPMLLTAVQELTARIETLETP
jgi:hypothetical protein